MGVVAVAVALGFKLRLALTACAAMVFGLPALGNVPTAWSGKPLADSARTVVEQDQFDMLIALTELELLKAL